MSNEDLLRSGECSHPRCVEPASHGGPHTFEINSSTTDPTEQAITEAMDAARVFAVAFSVQATYEETTASAEMIAVTRDKTREFRADCEQAIRRAVLVAQAQMPCYSAWLDGDEETCIDYRARNEEPTYEFCPSCKARAELGE